MATGEGSDMRTIPLNGRVAAGRVALVDDEDFELVTGYRWHAFIGRSRSDGRPNGPYARSGHLFMHALITGHAQTDHIDNDGLNNQRYNLRPATDVQNKANQRPRSDSVHSSYKGVSWKKRNPGRSRDYWIARIVVDGQRRTLGYFQSEEAAARAYDAAALAAWGEYAYLNFPVTASVGVLPEAGSPATSASRTPASGRHRTA